MLPHLPEVFPLLLLPCVGPRLVWAGGGDGWPEHRAGCPASGPGSGRLQGCRRQQADWARLPLPEWLYHAVAPVALTAPFPTGSCFWVAVLDGNVVGIVAARAHVADNTVELLRMSVDSRFRGKGIAKALGRKVLEFALVHNYSAVVLGTTAVKVAAHKLYESLGFRHMGSSDRYVMPGMTLSLAERLFFQVRYHRYRLQLREE